MRANQSYPARGTRNSMVKGGSIDLYLGDVKRYSNPHMSETALEGLSQRVCQGDRKARDELVTAHLYLVVRMANRHQYNDAELGDLIGAGNIGLVRAAELYQSDKCPVFAGYAVWWIRRMIRKFIAEHTHVMCVPEKAMLLMWHVSAVTNSFFASFGRNPSTEEICAAAGASAREVNGLLPETLHGAQYPLSLDEPCRDNSYLCWSDILTDSEAEKVDAQLMRDSDKHLLEHLIHDLKDKERLVLRSFYGLEGKKPRNLAEIGRTLGLTRERVRQIRDSALKRLRHPSRSDLIETLRDGN